jgi:hypothetical protein
VSSDVLVIGTVVSSRRYVVFASAFAEPRFFHLEIEDMLRNTLFAFAVSVLALASSAQATVLGVESIGGPATVAGSTYTIGSPTTVLSASGVLAGELGETMTLPTTYTAGQASVSLSVAGGTPTTFTGSYDAGASSANNFIYTGTIVEGGNSYTDSVLSISFSTVPGIGTTSAFTLAALSVPEPSSVALMGLGVLGLSVYRLRRKHSA